VAEASYRLLVVDDEPLALKLVERVFEPETDIEVHSDTSPERCLELAQAHDIDLVIADQRMPEMKGLQFLSRVRELRPRALRILLTAFPDTPVALTAINEGLVYRFILKPWEPEDMRVTVRRALETKRLADEHDRVIRQLKSSYDELVQAEQLTALGRISAGIGQELSHAVGPLLTNVRTLESQLARLLETVRSADRAFEHNFARAQTKLFDSEAVRADPPVKGHAEESLAVIRAAGERLDALVRTVSGYAVRGEPEPLDVNQTVLVAVQILSARFDPAIRLERDLRAVPLARCRRSEILQVVLNLLANAIEAVEKQSDPLVRVRTWPSGSNLRLEIADNGKGLPPTVERRLFQPFVSTKPTGRGSGMGLNICRGIVESHGGTIEAASKPGTGTTFTVTLPALGVGA
jgi:C4-dicarboxylate-specific signal transduction histidine kinase